MKKNKNAILSHNWPIYKNLLQTSSNIDFETVKDSVLLERLFLILKKGGGQYKQAVRTPLQLTTIA